MSQTVVISKSFSCADITNLIVVTATITAGAVYSVDLDRESIHGIREISLKYKSLSGEYKFIDTEEVKQAFINNGHMIFNGNIINFEWTPIVKLVQGYILDERFNL